MREIREVLRLRHEQGLSHQAMTRACGVGVGTVNRYLRGRRHAGSAGRCRPVWTTRRSKPDRSPRAAPARDRIRPDCAHATAPQITLAGSGATLGRRPRVALGAAPPIVPAGSRCYCFTYFRILCGPTSAA